ncbi:MAG: hypothetical protein K8R64_07045 [Methanosarcinaceae archaeon]|nr:hypothetical protein [Methanosarcinaceae archaeon]
MNTIKNRSALISGIALIAFGMWVIFLDIDDLNDKSVFVFALIFGGICGILGIYMLLNPEKEDSIEQIKTRK